jgi:tRNA(Ile)-lysidine synthase
MKNSWQWGLAAKALLDKDWLEKLGSYRHLFIGYSGGLDSTVLLHLLANKPDLVSKLTAVHVNHGLSPNASSWQQHCQKFCAELDVNWIIRKVEFRRQANIEEAARKARYEAFSALVTRDDCLILGHHLDDQAETLLLQLFRGAGIDGLAAMAACKEFVCGQILRPLLQHSRQDLESYAKEYQLKWIEDESNQDIVYTRNFLRHKVLPLLHSRWPAITPNLVRTASHCQQAQLNLEALAKIDCPALEEVSTRLDLKPLYNLSRERLINVLRAWLKSNKVKIPTTVIFNRLLNELIQASPDSSPLVAWKEVSIRRYRHILYLELNHIGLLPRPPGQAVGSRSALNNLSFSWLSFSEPLFIEGLGLLKAQKAARGFKPPVRGCLEVRFRQGGELFFWHGQTKALKKLLQEWQVPPWLRNRIPLLYVDGLLAVIVGYAVSDLFYTEVETKNSPLEFILQPADLEKNF